MLKISLVIPSFNAEAYIERAIVSIIQQDYASLELILVDGASQDGTMKIVEQYRSFFSVIISEPDSGQANAINKGFACASGDIYAYLCVDDVLAPGALMRVADLFLHHPDVAVITGGCTRFYTDQTVYNTIPTRGLLEKQTYCNIFEQPSTFWRAAWHKKVGPFDEGFYFAFDFEYWNRLLRAGASVLTVPDILSHFYFAGDNKTSRGGTALVREMYRVVKQYGPYHGFLADIYWFIYRYFDVYGCIDGLTAHSKKRGFLARCVWRCLLILFKREYIHGYPWNFAAKQERGLVWWK